MKDMATQRAMAWKLAMGGSVEEIAKEFGVKEEEVVEADASLPDDVDLLREYNKRSIEKLRLRNLRYAQEAQEVKVDIMRASKNERTRYEAARDIYRESVPMKEEVEERSEQVIRVSLGEEDARRIMEVMNAIGGGTIVLPKEDALFLPESFEYTDESQK